MLIASEKVEIMILHDRVIDLETELTALKQRLAVAEVEAFNEGIETAAEIFDRKEIFHYKVATWDRNQIVKGSKYCVPKNGPAIACAGAEKQAKEIRALKKPFLTNAPTDYVVARTTEEKP